MGTDANGYNFWPNMLSATGDGKRVSYVYRKPKSGGLGADHTGALEYRHVWMVRHDGLLFASGSHITADEYTKFVVDEAIARYHAEGLDAALEHHDIAESVDGKGSWVGDRRGVGNCGRCVIFAFHQPRYAQIQSRSTSQYKYVEPLLLEALVVRMCSK